MPIVETSVAVATPSITAARMMNGQGDRRNRDQESLADLASRGAAHARQILRHDSATRPVPPSVSPSTTPGSMPPVNSAAIETPVTEPMVISTSEGGMVSVWAPVAESSATSSPGFAPRLLHLREKDRGHSCHVGRLRTRDSGDQVHRADQDVGEPAADMPEQAGQEPDHRARHPRHLDQQAQQHEQRYGKQDQMAHAFVHAPDNDDVGVEVVSAR